MRKKKESKNKRRPIPDSVKLKVWNLAAGRCEFKGCNEILWRNELTLSDTNFGELAHIIAASEDGPRGTAESMEKQVEAENIMLLCPKCHKEVDNAANLAQYPAEVLIKMKEEHEERIAIVTGILPDNKTEILRFIGNIGDRKVNIELKEIKSVLVENGIYPAGKGILIDRSGDDGDGKPEYWDYIAGEIKRTIHEHLKYRGNTEKEIKSLSVFALAPIPFLMILGNELSDTHFNKIDLYQRHRDSQSWRWPSSCDYVPNLIVKRPANDIRRQNVALKISLSDYVSLDKISPMIDNSFDIYEITIDEIPSTNYLKTPAQIAAFEYEFRKILNEIQANYGKDAVIHFFPAVPAPIAIKCGMCLLPKKDNPILIYDYNKRYGGFRPLLRLNP